MNSSKVSLLILILIASTVKLVFAQPIEVINTQYLNFGVFCQNDDAGGTVTISNTGSRSATGNMTLFSSSHSCAAYTITTDSTNQFSLQISQPEIDISGSDGGSMLLQIGSSNPEFPTVISGQPATIYLGGTLKVASRSENPAGTYSGNYLLYFNFYYE